MDNYIKIPRVIIQEKFWTQEPFSKGQAWIDLIAMASKKKITCYGA